MDCATSRLLLDRFLDLYDAIMEVHSQTTERLARLKSRRTRSPSDASLEDSLDVSLYSPLYHNVEMRNGLSLREGRTDFAVSVIDSQSTPSNSRSPLNADHLTVITSVASSLTLRYEELALLLLRGVIERYLLKVNPCQNNKRETLPPSYTTNAKTYTTNQWKEVMQLARGHSSECTVQVVKLYPQVAVLRAEVQLKLLSKCSSFDLSTNSLSTICIVQSA